MGQRITSVILISLLLSLPQVSPVVFAGSAVQNRLALRQIKALYISIDSLDPEIEKDGLRVRDVRSDAEQILRKARIKILSKEEWYEESGNPYLYVTMDIIKLPSTDEYVYAIRTAFKENVYPERQSITITGATTWTTGGIIGITGSLDKIRNAIRIQIDEFIEAYTAVNLR